MVTREPTRTRTNRRVSKTEDLADDPKKIRRRLQKNGDRALERLRADVAALYPEKPIEEWDFEELQAGFPRDANGEFNKKYRYGEKRPKWITPVVLEEAAKRLKTMTRREMGMYAGDAIKVMAQLMQNSRVDLVKFNAAKYILDQLIGMPTQRIEAEGTINVQSFLATVMENMDGEKYNVIEGTIVEDDEDDEYDDGE